MTQFKRSSMWAVLVIGVALAFMAGAFWGSGIGGGALLKTMTHLAQITSGTFRPASDAETPHLTNLGALEIFWEVRRKVRDNFVYPMEDDSTLTYGAIRGMLAALDDPYTRFLEPEEYKEFRTDTSGHFDGIGAVLEAKTDDATGKSNVIISSILPGGPASKSVLRPHDVILMVDEKRVEGLTLTEVVKLIRGPRGTEVVLTIKRDGVDEPIKVSMVRANIEVPVVEYKMIDEENKIGYLWLRSFNQVAEKETREALADLQKQGMKGLLLDMSMDPGGILDVAVEIGSFFIDSGPIVHIKSRDEGIQTLTAIPGKSIAKDIAMVTLIDGGSASASEIVAGALQDTGRSLVVGQPSFGKSKVQTIIELRDSSALFLSTAVYLTPKKRDIGERDPETGERGVQPDIRYPDPDPNTDMDYKQWHEKQVEMALNDLRKRMGLN